MQAYTIHDNDWQEQPQQPKELPDVIHAHLRACQVEAQQRVQQLPDPNQAGAYQAVLNSICDDVAAGRGGPWVGSDKAHYKHTFKGRTCKEVEIDMAPGSMVRCFTRMAMKMRMLVILSFGLECILYNSQ